MDWTAFDLGACKPWYFDVGGPHNDLWANSKEWQELQTYRLNLSRVEPDDWLALVAESTGSNQSQAFADCAWSQNRTTIRCFSYGSGAFPTGNATYKYSPNANGAMPRSLKCIKNCQSTRVKVIFDHGWEEEGNEPENREYVSMKKAAIKRCGKAGEAW